MFTMAVAPVAAPLIVCVGAIATISSLCALEATVVEEKRGDSISMGEYFSRTLSAAVSLNTGKELVEIVKGKYTFETFAEETDMGKCISYMVPHLPNQFVTEILQLTTFIKISEDKVNDNALHNITVLQRRRPENALKWRTGYWQTGICM